MEPKFNYPTEIKGRRKLYSLVNGLSNPLDTISGNHRIAGDSYRIKANFTNKNFIFSQTKEFVEYILKQNHTNYYNSELQSVTGYLIGKVPADQLCK